MICKEGANSPCGKSCCCWSCEERESCRDACASFTGDAEAMEKCPCIVKEENALAVFQTKAVNVIQNMVQLLQQKKALEEKEKTVREELTAAMDAFGIKSFENDSLKVTFKAASVRSGVDSKALKAKFPEVYKEVQTETPVKASIAISLKK